MQGSTQSAGGGDGDEEPNKKYWVLNIKRYRRFFNVDTEVSCCPAVNLQRHLISVTPNRSKSRELNNVNVAQCVQDILVRIRDSVIGSYKADFFDKTTDNADL